MKKKMKALHEAFDERDKTCAETDSDFKRHYESDSYKEIRKACRAQDRKNATNDLITDAQSSNQLD